MNRLRALRSACLTMGLLHPIGTAEAQDFYRTTPEREAGRFTIQVPMLVLGTDFDGDRLDARSPYAFGRFSEWIRFRASAVFFAPEYLRLDVTGRSVFGQQFDDRSDGRMAHDRFVGSVSLRILEGFGIQSVLEAERVDDYQDDPFGGFKAIDETTFRATVRDVNPLLPVEATFEQVSGHRMFSRSDGRGQLEFDREMRRFRFQGQNSKTRVLVRRLDASTVSGGQFERSLRDQALVENRHRWGKGSSALAKIDYRRHRFDSEMQSVQALQFVRLQHSQSIWSEYRYTLSRENGLDWRASDSEAEVVLNGSLGRSVNSSVGFLRARRRIDSGLFREHQLRPRLSFGVELFERLQLQGSVSGILGWRRQLESAPQFAWALEERHTVDSSGRFRLFEASADITSVQIVDEADGTSFELDFDYRIVEEGPFLSVIAAPGGRMAEGTNVVVTYRYAVTGASEGKYVNGQARGSLTWGGLRLFGHRRIARGGSDGGGHGAFSLTNIDQLRMGVGWQYESPRTKSRVSAEWDRAITDEVVIRNRTVVGSVSYRHSRGLTLTAGGRRLDGKWGADGISMSEVEQSVTWRASYRVTVSGQIAFVDWDQPAGRERYLGFGGQVTWHAGPQQVEVRVSRSRWDRDVQSVRDQIIVRVSRELR